MVKPDTTKVTYEYKIITLLNHSTNNIEEKFKKLGDEGFCLIHSYDAPGTVPVHNFIFERAKIS